MSVLFFEILAIIIVLKDKNNSKTKILASFIFKKKKIIIIRRKLFSLEKGVSITLLKTKNRENKANRESFGE